jgi:predicted glycosyltransferase
MLKAGMRFFFYSHDGMGLGHTRRHLAVATALAERAPRAAILLATSAEEIARFGLPRQVEILKLPGLRKDSNEAYSSRRLRVSVTEIRELRSAFLLTAIKSFRPDVVLVDKHPFGASGEFKAGLKALRRNGGRAVLGLRDILDDPQQVQREWGPYQMQQRIARYYDEVTIYGDRAVFDPVEAYAFPPQLAARTHFCGYVLSRENSQSLENFEWPFPPARKRNRPVVLATTGGGEDGFRILETFIRASRKAEWQGVVIAGPMIPDAQWTALQKLALLNGVAYRNFVPHLSALFGSIDALVCMGGYNTLIEAAAENVPTVCVPRVKPRVEQLMRANAFEKLGLLQVCHPTDLDPATLRLKIIAALASAKMTGTPLHFNGAELAASRLLTLGAKRRVNHQTAELASVRA